MPDENDIRNLLRLKRYEQPPPEYFDTFLRDFHRRQRAEMLRAPLWKIALDRLHAFFGEHAVGRYAYAGATAMVLIAAGMTSMKIVTPSSQIAADSGTGGPVREHVQESHFALNAPIRNPDWNALPSVQVSAPSSSARPHYVIDARPVSYESPGSF